MNLAYGLTMDARTIIEKQGRIYLSGNTGISVLDSKTKATIHSFHDFFDAETLLLSNSGQYLLASNYFYGARIYDVVNMRIYGDIRCPGGFHIYPCWYTFSLDDESIYLCFNVFEQEISIFDSIPRMPGLYGIRSYPLNNLTAFQSISFPKNMEITKLIPMRKRKNYLAISEQGKLFYFDGIALEDIPVSSLDSCYRGVEYDEKNDWLYLEENHGIRVYDRFHQEVNRLDFSWLRKRDNNIYVRHYDKINMDASPMRIENDSDINEVRQFCLFQDRYLVLYSGDTICGISLVTVLDRFSGKPIAEKKFIGPIQSIHSLEQGIAISLKEKIHILEVEDDRYL